MKNVTRHFTALTLLWAVVLHCYVLSAKVLERDFLVGFPIGSKAINVRFAENAKNLAGLTDYLNSAAGDSCTGLVSVKFSGSASPDGKFSTNARLSRARMDALCRYVRSHASFPDSVVNYSSDVVVWSRLDSMVSSSNLYYRDDVLRIIRDSLTSVTAKNRQLIRLDGGRVWSDLFSRFFPRMRNACAVVITTRRSTSDMGNKITPPCKEMQTAASAADQIPENTVIADTVQASAEDLHFISTSKTEMPLSASSFCMAVKTNMLYDALLVPNIGVEIPFADKWSASASWMYAWWSCNSRHNFWRTYGGDIEVRRYFGGKSDVRRLTGHHIGVYGQMLTYDFELGGTGWLADRWSYAAGISYGYSLSIGRHLNIDFSIGLGYLGGTYKKYTPDDGCYAWLGTYSSHVFGPTKAEVSLVWLIGNSRKGGGR